MTDLTCNVCDKPFALKSNLTRHLKIHANKREYKCSYEGCTADFNTSTTRNSHFKRVHLNLKPHKCSYKNCSKEYFRKERLNQHVNGTHLNIKKYKCSYKDCKESFNRTDMRKTHIERVHLKLKPHKCQYKDCCNAFYLKLELKEHVNQVHLNYKFYECKYNNCNKKYKTKSKLKRHVEIFHLKIERHKCIYNNCIYSFYDKSKLNEHINVVHLELKLFKCEVCKKFFGRKTDLGNHKKVHTTPYQQRQKKKEQRIATFLDNNKIIYNREHRIDFGNCINSKEGYFCMLDFTLLTKKGDHLIVIECDEEQHKRIPISCEVRRMNDAYTSVITDKNPLKGIHWIRFNPDNFKINGIKKQYYINDKFKQLKATVINIQNNPPNNNFSITYLFYDIVDKKPEIIKDNDFPEHFKENLYCYPIE